MPVGLFKPKTRRRGNVITGRARERDQCARALARSVFGARVAVKLHPRPSYCRAPAGYTASTCKRARARD